MEKGFPGVCKQRYFFDSSSTLFSMSSLIFLTSGSDFPFGFLRSQSTSFFCICASFGIGKMFAIEQPIVMTRLARLIISGVSMVETFRERSIPFSFIASNTLGFNGFEGAVPALEVFQPVFLRESLRHLGAAGIFDTDKQDLMPFFHDLKLPEL